MLRQAQKLGTDPLSIALVADAAKVRDILSGGAHFVLYKPVSEEAAKAGIARRGGSVEPGAAPGIPGSGAGPGGDHAAGHSQSWMAFFWICLKPAWTC